MLMCFAAPTTSSSNNGERTPLLPGSNSNSHSGTHSSLLGRRNSHIHLNGQPGNPTYAASFKSLILYSPINILLIAVPFSFASHFAGWWVGGLLFIQLLHYYTDEILLSYLTFSFPSSFLVMSALSILGEPPLPSSRASWLSCPSLVCSVKLQSRYH